MHAASLVAFATALVACSAVGGSEAGSHASAADAAAIDATTSGVVDTDGIHDAAADATLLGDGAPSLNVLVFSATAGYRHASIPDGIAAFQLLATQRGWTLSATEDATQFQDGTLAAVDVIVFLLTTGDVLDTDQQGALVRYVQSGKGWVGIHSASDTEHDWAWYGGLVGAYFASHPDIQEASIRVEDPTFPATSFLPDPWVRTDEWYAFTSNPRGRVHVLLSLDESSYSPGDSGMDGDHPIAWYQEYEGGRSFYTALGHTSSSYQEPLFLAHLANAVEWAGGR